MRHFSKLTKLIFIVTVSIYLVIFVEPMSLIQGRIDRDDYLGEKACLCLFTDAKALV